MRNYKAPFAKKVDLELVNILLTSVVEEETPEETTPTCPNYVGGGCRIDGTTPV